MDFVVWKSIQIKHVKRSSNVYFLLFVAGPLRSCEGEVAATGGQNGGPGGQVWEVRPVSVPFVLCNVNHNFILAAAVFIF